VADDPDGADTFQTAGQDPLGPLEERFRQLLESPARPRDGERPERIFAL
jgi:hypothetical protein